MSIALRHVKHETGKICNEMPKLCNEMPKICNEIKRDISNFEVIQRIFYKY